MSNMVSVIFNPIIRINFSLARFSRQKDYMISGKSMAPANEIEYIKQEYLSYIDNKDFACIGAKAALVKEQIQCFVADNMACPKDDRDILNFLYTFIDDYRNSNELYYSAAVIFKGPGLLMMNCLTS